MSETNPRDRLASSAKPNVGGGTIEAPTNFFGVLKRLGPGLIIAGSIVGSGELIATTKTGAQAGISLLWLIVIGCLIKVFVQIELGRYTISSGETTLAALNRVPGPRFRVNWIVWFWVAMVTVGIGQLGGIAGGVGQAMALSFPIKGDYADATRMPSTGELEEYLEWDDLLLSEWNLKLYLKWRGRIDGRPAALGDLTEDESEWVRHAVRVTAERLDELNRSPETQVAGERVVAATEDLLGTEEKLATLQRNSETGREELQQAREEFYQANRSLQDLFEQVNIALLEQAPVEELEGGSPLKRLTEQNAEQRRRTLRGHVVLADQLAELDEEDHRATRAIAAVIRLSKSRAEWQQAVQSAGAASADLEERLASARERVNELIEPATTDDKFWAAAATLLTIVLLYRGKYGMIQNVSMFLVVAFTFITIGNAMALQTTEEFHISTAQLLKGLSFGLPEATSGATPLLTALATFGIIGVGASELIAYPYWCQEKGYGRFTGRRSDDDGWTRRARGWIRVMHYDTFLSMVVYTIATLAFFLMGVAVLHNEGRDPDGMRMVSTLATAYVPVFGEYARWLFLIGAIAVLYSTFLVATAGLSRVITDFLKVSGLISPTSQQTHDRSISTICVIVPLLCLTIFWIGINPVEAILMGGIMQAMMLPMIGLGALYCRYTRTDPRLRPGLLWDVMLIVSFVGLFVAGTWGGYSRIGPLFGL